MKLGFKFILIFLSAAAATKGKVLLIGSNILPENSPYKIFMPPQGSESSPAVTLNGQHPNIVPGGENRLNELQFEIPNDRSQPFLLNAQSNDGSTCEQTLERTQQRPLIFIQLDKPIYKTGTEIKFRTFVVTQKLLPMKSHGPMEVKITDSRGNEMYRNSRARVDNFGMFEATLKIANSKNVGNWTIKVEVNGREAKKYFLVQGHNEKDLEVFVETDSKVAYENRKVYLTIFVKKQNDGKSFNGYVEITMAKKSVGSNGYDRERTITTKSIESEKTGIILDIERDLKIFAPVSDLILKFNVKVAEDSSKKSVAITKEVTMRAKGKNNIQVIRKKYFKPGFNFPIKVRVLKMDGNKDNSFNQLKITVTNENVNKRTGTTMPDTKTIQMDLKHGEIVRNLIPTAQTKRMNVVFEFAGTELTETIEPLPTFGADEYMEVKVLKKTKDSYLLGATTTGQEMETLHLLVFGSNGIIHSQEFPEAAGVDVFNFTMTLTDEMKPEARGLVFYIHSSSGAIVYDEFAITPGFSIDNKLELSVPESVKPNETVDVTAVSVEGSKVFLTGIDDIASQISKSHDIYKADIIAELTTYMTAKFPRVSTYHFERLNGFILDPSLCNQQVSKIDKSDDLNAPDQVESGDKYFPEVWIKEVRDIPSTNETSFSLNASKVKGGSWRFNGISVHPTKGFTVSQTQPILRVAEEEKKDNEIKISTLAFYTNYEVFEVQILVSNSVKSRVNGTLTITAKSGTMVETKETYSNGKVCKNYVAKVRPVSTSKIELSPEKKRVSSNIFVRGHTKEKNESSPVPTEEDIVIEVSSNFGGKTFTETKIIPYKSQKTFNKDFKEMFLIEIKDGERFSESLRLETQKTADKKPRGFTELHSNLFGPALNGLSGMFPKTLGNDEGRMLEFSSSLINYKYFELTGQSKKDRVLKAHQDIQAGYQEAQAVSKNLLKVSNSNNLMLAALIAENLIDSKNVMEINENLSKKLFDYIIGQQEGDGSFKYDSESDPRRKIGDERKVAQTTYILSVLLKDEEVKGEYQQNIERSMQFLDRNKGKFQEDYGKALTAYTFALDRQTQNAREMLGSMSSEYMQMKNPKDFSANIMTGSYKILAKLLINEDPKEDVKWLIKYRNVDGTFYSPYDTVLALKALFEYMKSKNFHTENLKFTVNGKEKSISGPLDSQKIDVEYGNVNIAGSGQGLGYAAVYSEHYGFILLRDSFTLSVTTNAVPNEENEVDITVNYQLNDTSIDSTNMVVLEVNLPRGYTYKSSDAENVDTMNGRNLVVLYINKMERDQIFSVTIRASKEFDVFEHSLSEVKIYDYYRPHLSYSTYFMYDSNLKKCDKSTN